jgi:hypothetical protein
MIEENMQGNQTLSQGGTIGVARIVLNPTPMASLSFLVAAITTLMSGSDSKGEDEPVMTNMHSDYANGCAPRGIAKAYSPHI